MKLRSWGWVGGTLPGRSWVLLLASACAAGCGSSSSATPTGDAGGTGRDGGHEAGKGADASTPGDAGAHRDAADASSPRDAESLDGWSVPSGCNPLAVTSECLLPYPSDLLTVPDPTTPTGLRLALPANALTIPPGATPISMTPFNRFDGAPTSEPILVHFGVEVGASSLCDETQTAASILPTSPIALFNEATGERVPFLSEMDANDPTATTRHALIIRPLTPLAFGTKYVVAISSAVRDAAGGALPASPGFVALRDKVPTAVAPLEAARPHFESIFGFLSAHGYPRDGLALAWDYTTASSKMVLGPITTMRQEVFRAATGAAPAPPDGGADSGASASGDAGADETITYTIDSVTASTDQPGANIIEGTFTPPNYLRADNTILFGADGTPTLETGLPRPSYPFTMIVPPLAATQSLGLVLFGHGLFGAGRSYLTTSYGSTIQPLAQQLGSVVVATDWIGLSSGDLQLIISDVVPDLNRVGVVTDRLLQALVNNLSLIELSLGALGSDPQVRMSTAQPLLDPTRVHYYGVSLGGIEGSSLISVSRNITRAAVAVPGASWSNLLARSSDYQQIGGAIALAYPDKLLQQEFIALLQSRFDPADPINLATLFQTNPLPDSPSARTVVIQESIADCQVPNLTTELLARAYGVPEVTPDIVPIFGLATISTPTTKSALSQFKLTSDVAKYTPPTSNVTPTTDNGAHFDLAFQAPVLAEVATLLTTGSIVQSCGDGGACILP